MVPSSLRAQENGILLLPPMASVRTQQPFNVASRGSWRYNWVGVSGRRCTLRQLYARPIVHVPPRPPGRHQATQARLRSNRSLYQGMSSGLTLCFASHRQSICFHLHVQASKRPSLPCQRPRYDSYHPPPLLLSAAAMLCGDGTFAGWLIAAEQEYGSEDSCLRIWYFVFVFVVVLLGLLFCLE